jgi:uncharacterized protein (TIGR02271 family)
MSETIVAVFDTATQAEAAIRELEAAGVPANTVRHYTKDDAAYEQRSSTGETHHRGFWSWLVGADEPGYDHALFDRTLQSGGTVVTVVTDEHNAEHVSSILLAHAPVDFEERASEYGLTQSHGVAGTITDASTSETLASGTGTRSADAAGQGGATAPTGRAATSHAAGKEEVIPLAEEVLEVSKRAVTRTTRLRRYVVERPVEEQVRLRDETVTVERRPVSSTATVPPDAFTEKTIEVTEAGEEAVVTKTAGVREEVVVRKDATERVETVRDTVRRQEIDIEGDAGTKPATGASLAGKPTAPTEQP